MPRGLIRRPDRTRRWSGQRAQYPEVRMAILWLGDEACDDVQLVGGKAANLSRLALGYRVPTGVLNHPRPVPSIADHPRPRAGPEQDLRDLRNLVSRLSMYSLLVLLLSSRDDSSLRIGMILFAMSAGMTVSSCADGRLIDRVGRRIPTTSGLVILADRLCRPGCFDPHSAWGTVVSGNRVGPGLARFIDSRC